jgi:PST family polysaccharide transporter
MQVWGIRVLSFIVFAVLARTIAPQAFGIVALAAVFVAFFEGTVVQSFADALVRRKSVDQQHLDVCFWITVAFGALAAALLYLLAGLAASSFHQPELRPVLHWLAAGIPISALGRVHEALLRRDLQFKRLAVRSLITVLVSSTVAVCMAVGGFEVWALVAKTLIEAVCSSTILWLSHPWRPRRSFSRAHLHDLQGFGTRLAVTRFLELITQRIDTVVIGGSLGPVPLAQYTVGQRVSRLMMDSLHSSISNVSLPAFATMQDEHARLRAAYLRTIRFTAFVAMPAFAVVAVLAHDIVLLVFGPQWQAAVPVLTVFAAGGAVFSFSFFVAPLLLAKGHAEWYLRLVLLNLVQGVLLILAAPWGIIAVAAVLVFRDTLTSVAGLFLVRKAIGVKFIDTFEAIRGPLLLTTMMAGIIFALSQTDAISGSGLWRLGILVPLAATIYLVGARIFNAALLHEIISTLSDLVPLFGRIVRLTIRARS